jgi:hypothetical protein
MQPQNHPMVLALRIIDEIEHTYIEAVIYFSFFLLLMILAKDVI